MIKTLVIDGNNLLKIGVCGVKDFYNNGEHVGGIWHFLNTTRRFLDEGNYNKVVVCWDSESNSTQRRLFYPNYKLNRRQANTEEQVNSFSYQKTRVKQYLEEMFIRHIEIDDCEADDIIAYYCKISKDEHKTIFSSDRDLTQLISEDVSIYSPSTKKHYKNGDMIKMCDVEIPHYNVKTWKILSGDKSDNINGIYYLGEKTLVKLFPELLDKEVNIDDLSEPLISEEGKELVESYYSESMDPDGRGHRNLIRFMMNDGFFKYLPKGDDAWVSFLKPFLKLTRKEKTNFKNKKK
jgi:5'-3' exonuclease